MKSTFKIIGLLSAVAAFILVPAMSRRYSRNFNILPAYEVAKDTTEPDSLKYPFNNQTGGVYGNDPSNYSEEVEYDIESGQYIVTHRIGGIVSGAPMFMTAKEYEDYITKKQVADYWAQKTKSKDEAKEEGRDPGNSLIPSIQVNSEAFNRLFGSNTIDIRPQGYAELSFGGRIQKVDNPIIPERNRSTFNFDFDQRIQMNVTGKIGEKMEIRTNYDTEATFSFENQVKVEFTGDEDDIIKKIELGNVSLPLNSSLITGAQSLFGVKGQFQFGKLTLTGVFSEQRSQSSSIDVSGGATSTDFEIWGDEYEANKHYFLSHYFRDNYEQFLEQMPLLTSPVQITKVEVWVTNTRQETDNTRNIVAFMDLGESDNPGAYRNTQDNIPGPTIFNRFYPNQGFPDNRNNALDPEALENTYPGVRDITQVNQELNSAGFEESVDYTDLSNARRLRESEYDFHPQLGYLSVSSSLNQDEVLAVAFQFTAGGKTFQVGEFSTDGVTAPQNLVLKMLKSTILNVRVPMWDLMMKNIYSLSAYQVNREDFRLEVFYQDDETGTAIPFLPKGNLTDQLLIRVMGLDRNNVNNDPQPDGFFDFINNVTINSQNGRIIFPVLEPFGSNLESQLTEDEIKEIYVFQELYDSTRFIAQNETQKNKFLLRGRFKSASGSTIQLNAFNIPEGSVVVTAGGATLVEGVQYQVNYLSGTVQILDDALLSSGTPIRVSFENSALFNFQTRTYMGLTADYKFNENLNVGATVVRLSERPLTQKVNIGDEPIANTIIGVNGQFSNEAPYLTRFVDKIPFLDTKAKSSISVQAEAAKLIPGSPSGIEINGEETTYLDDFESSQTSIDIKNPNAWILASTPAGQPDLFPEGDLTGQPYGYNRAKLAWYTIDPLFHRDDARTPDNIRNNKDLQSGQYVRQVLVEEVFPNLQLDQSQARNIGVLDLAFYPEERGPYNYDVEGLPGVSSGINPDGTLQDPDTRWGGIMRELSTTNFEEQNIEFIQFWMLDPFMGVDGATDGGELYFNLGSVSEDILKDGAQAIENGIPISGDISQLDTSSWGFIPRARPPVIAFNTDESSRGVQDVGYDLMTDAQEGTFAEDPASQFSYLDRLANDPSIGNSAPAYLQALVDPAYDNFQYFRGDELDQQNADILERYKDYNNPQGNSTPVQIDGISAFATNRPDIEDINRDQTLSKTETYFQYEVNLDPGNGSQWQVGENYVTDILETTSQELPNGKTLPSRWIQFKIPVFSPDSKVGSINDFRSIRFMRMFVKNFDSPVVLRFARLELIRGEWRRYQFNLDAYGEELESDGEGSTIFEVNAVNIEQNATRSPIPYAVPPGIDRQILFGTSSSQQQNEQALSLRVLNLEDGAARAVFRNMQFDMRLYKRLRMFAHAESAGLSSTDLRDGDLTVFIRVGSDYSQNYYEYEIPLEVTDWGATDSRAIWPEANEFDFELDLLRDVKLERDRVYRDQNLSIVKRYSSDRGKATISVVGAPSLGNVRTILIGVRNPRKRFGSDGDNGLPLDAEVWVNELRLTEFDQRGGYAANARVAAQLADFANVSLSGAMSTIGFGSLDQKVQERQMENMYSYNLQTSFELGKFFPKDAGLRIPMFYSSSEEWKNPQFSPLDPDIEFDEAIANEPNEDQANELKSKSQDYTSRRALNFTNVKKERVQKPSGGQAKPKVYDIENFSASYSWSESSKININSEEDRRTDHRGSLNYNYQTQPKAVEPFKNTAWLKSKNLSLIRDFNFNWYPRNFTAIATVNRSLTTLRQRNIAQIENPTITYPPLPTTYNRNFTFDRQYSMLWDLSKSLKLDYRAQMNARIDELADNDLNGNSTDFTEQERKDFIWANVADFGRPTNYHQTVNLNWQVPINKVPLLDFMNLSARYTGDYDWMANSLRATASQDGDPTNSLNFGNTVQNNRQIQSNTNLNLVTLYNKVPYLRKINQGANNRKPQRRQSLRSRNPKTSAEKEKEKEEDEEPSTLSKVMAGTAKVLMMVKNGSVNYSQSDGTILPGFLPSPDIIGMSTTNANAPGFLFTVGSQADIRQTAVDNNWLTTTALQNNQYTVTAQTNLDFRTLVEPVAGLRINVTASRRTSSTESEFFRFDTLSMSFESQNPFQTETFSMSYYMLPTAWETFSAPDYESEAYQAFLDNRIEVSRQLAEEYALTDPNYTVTPPTGDPDSSNYGYQYYSITSQDVLIPAFLAAYSGRDINGYDLGYKKSTPLPNWQITYDGLGKKKFMRKYFTSIVLNHAYRSTYTVANVTTNLLRQQSIDDGDPPIDNNGDLYSVDQIAAINLTEQFAPLIGVNMKLRNSMTLRVEYKRDRNIILSMANAQITETNGSEWVIGAGYIIKDVRLKFIKMGKRKTNPVSNLELRAEIGIRDNITLIRRIVEQTNTATAGQRNVTAKLSGDYQLSSRVSAKLFYDLNLSRFKTSNAYPLTNHAFGVSIRLNLGQ